MSQKIVVHVCTRVPALTLRLFIILILGVSFCSSEAITQAASQRATLNPSTDLTYVGSFQMPGSLPGGSYNTGGGWGLAFRNYNGTPHLLTTAEYGGGTFNSALYEVVIPTPSTSFPGPTATVYKNWDSTNGSNCFPQQVWQNNNLAGGTMLSGLYWDSSSSRLYYTIAGRYDQGGNYTNRNVFSFVTLNDSTGACTSDVSYGISGVSNKAVNMGILGIPADFQSQYGVGSLGIGFGGDQSAWTAGPVSMGPSLAAFSPPTAGSGNNNSLACSGGGCLSNTLLINYPFGGSTRSYRPDTVLDDYDMNQVDCAGNPSTYTACPYNTGKDTAYWTGYSVNSSSWSQYLTVGSSITIDSASHGKLPGNSYWNSDFINQGGVWIQTANKEGLLFLGNFAVGRNRYLHSAAYDDGIQHAWLIYSRSQLASTVPTSKGGGGASVGSIQPTWSEVRFPGIVYPAQGAGPTNYVATSSTSMTIGYTSQTFTVSKSPFNASTNPTGLAFTVGMPITIFEASNGANYMQGTITAYSGTSMTVNVGDGAFGGAQTGGSGTYSDWYIVGGMYSGCGGATTYGYTFGVTYDPVGQNLYVGITGASNGDGTWANNEVYVYHVNDPATPQNVTTYTVTPGITTGENGYGSISPSTAQTVSSGSTASFTVSPGAGYTIAGVTDTCGSGGASIGSLSGNTYTTGSVTANCSVTASFAAGSYTITPSAGSYGSISPSTGQTVSYGKNETFTITPNTGCQVTSVLIDGVSIGATGSYTFSDVTANHTISATFAPITYTITPTGGSNGTISPSSTVTVSYGGSQAFTITPAANCQVSSVLVDGTSVGAVTGYTFSDVTANHTISATFAPITYTITPTFGANGTISPSSTVTVSYGGSQAFTIAPAANCQISSVLVDGASVGAVTGYTFSGVTANHTIAASFTTPTVTQYTVTPGAGSNGTISPSASVQVTSGGTETFTVTPNSGYTASVGGTCGGSLAGTTYTTNAITANCTVTAAFSQQQASGSLIQSSNVTYLGAFLVPSTGSWGVAETYYGGQAIGFNPNGNGGAGSLLIEGLSGQNTNGLYTAEISIPNNANLYTGSSTLGFTSSSTAGFVSPNSSSPYLWDISQGNYMDVGSGGANESGNCQNGWGIGGLYVNGSGTIYGTSFCFYDNLEEASGAEGAGFSVLPLFTHTDTTASPLSGSTFSGMYGLNIGSKFPGNTGDLTSGALASIPSAYQSQLGGTMLVGANPHGIANVARTSDGPALTAFNPANFAAPNTFPSSVNANVLVSYPENHQTLGAWGSVINQYTSESDGNAAIAFPPNSQSVLVVGTHALGGPGLACPSMATSGINCYGEFTTNCSEVCMASPPSGSGIPACGSGNSTCGGYSRGTWDCCYNPVGLAVDPGGHGNSAWPIVSYVWAYDVGNPDGSNTSGNNVASMPSTASGYTGNTTRNNLTAVKLGYVNPWDLYPYATWQLNDPFNAAANQAQSGYVTGGTYDPVSGKLYISLNGGQWSTALPIVEVYQITPPVTPPAATQYTITASAGSHGGISPSGSIQVSSGGTQQFTVTPNAGYSVSVGGTCGGALSANTFTTSPITESCTVTATFSLIPPPAAPFLPN